MGYTIVPTPLIGCQDFGMVIALFPGKRLEGAGDRSGALARTKNMENQPMRKLLLSLAFVGLLFAPAQAFGAAATFTGTLTVVISDLATLTATGSGTGSTGGAGGTATIPGGVFTLKFGTPVIPPLANLFPGLVVGATGLTGQFIVPVPTAVPAAANGALSWGGVTGTTGIAGSAYLAGFWGGVGGANCMVGCSAALSVPIPLGVVGSGGTVTFQAGPISASVIGNPYQLGGLTLTGGLLNTASGTIPNPVSIIASGVDGRSAGAAPSSGGNLTIVSPVAIKLGALGNLPAISILSLDFHVIPEPGTLLLLGSGIAGLAMLGRRARK